jgi:hypothetical protein
MFLDNLPSAYINRKSNKTEFDDGIPVGVKDAENLY